MNNETSCYGRRMRVKPARGGSNAGGFEPPTSPDSRSGAIARRSAILLSGTAVIALSIAQPASAISINDQVAAAASRTISLLPFAIGERACAAFRNQSMNRVVALAMR
jgi:hypothetical protein